MVLRHKEAGMEAAASRVSWQLIYPERIHREGASYFSLLLYSSRFNTHPVGDQPDNGEPVSRGAWVQPHEAARREKVD